MMHVLICSYEFGFGQGPEGICGMRLAHALLDAGARVTAITSSDADPDPGRAGLDVIGVESKCFRPEPAFRLAEHALGRLYHRNLHHFWQSRVVRAALPDGIDFVYGRCMPFGSGLAAERLARKIRKPLLVHFSDPLFSPWYAPPPLATASLRRLYRRVTTRALAVSFVTREAITYSERTTRVALGAKAFVLNHVAPPSRVLGQPKGSGGPTFVYAGRFYGHRKPDTLLQGFAKFRARSPGAVLRFVGPEADAILAEAARLGIADSIQVLPFTADPTPHFERADVLIATDANDETPVFLATKVVEYFMVDRRVLLVTPPSSPAAQLASKSPATVVAVRESADAIAAGMSAIVAMPPDGEAFRKRFLAMDDFSGRSVANELLRHAPSGPAPS
jgi:glycosyltransferase involved in cell wall biosynthesis